MVCNKDTCLVSNSLIIIYVCNCGNLGYYKCNIYCLSICQLYGRIWLQRVQGLPREENIPPINCRGQKFQVMFLVCSGTHFFSFFTTSPVIFMISDSIWENFVGGYDNYELFYSRDGLSVHLWTGGVMVLDIVFNVSGFGIRQYFMYIVQLVFNAFVTYLVVVRTSPY